VLAQLEEDKKITEVEGIGCEPVTIQVTRDELMECVARGISKGTLPFPEVNGPVLWPQYGLEEALASSSVKDDPCNGMHQVIRLQRAQF